MATAADLTQRRVKPADPINQAQALTQARARSPMPNVTGNLIDAGQQASREASRGNYAGAAGQLVGGVIRTPIAAAHDIGSGAASLLQPLGRFVSGVAGSSAQAAQPKQAIAASPAAAPAAAPAPQALMASPGTIHNAERGGQAVATPPLLGGVNSGRDVDGAPGVKRFDRGGKTLYSNVGGTESNDELMAGKGGTVSAVPSAAGMLLQPSGSPALDAQLSAARLAAANRGDFAAVAGSYGQPAGQGANPLMDQITSGLQSGKKLTARGAQALLELQRNQTAEGAQQLTAQRQLLEAHGMQADARAKQLTVRNAEDLEAARREYLTAQTPEARKVAEDRLRALRGEKEVPELFTTQVMQGQVDALGNRSPAVAVITDKRTGAVRLVGADGRPVEQGAAAAQPLPKDKGQLAVGAVYQTARGLAKWDGSQFIPLAQ